MFYYIKIDNTSLAYTLYSIYIFLFIIFYYITCAPWATANNHATFSVSVLWRLRDYLLLLMGRPVVYIWAPTVSTVQAFSSDPSAQSGCSSQNNSFAAIVNDQTSAGCFFFSRIFTDRLFCIIFISNYYWAKKLAVFFQIAVLYAQEGMTHFNLL